MKKYILATLILFIPCVTYALTMCARDNSLVVALNPSISGTGTYNVKEFMWRANFEYGTILGEATCLAAYETEAVDSNGYISQDIPKGLFGTAPINPDNPEANRSRRFCFCRMTQPAMSHWVYMNDLGSGCSVSCAQYCFLDGMRNSPIFRAKIFNSIGQ